MELKERYEKFAYNLSGKWAEKYLLKYFTEIHIELQKADLRSTLVEYMSVALTTSVITFIALVPLIAVIITILLTASGFIAFKASLIGIFIGLAGGILAGLGIFMFFYIYPSLIIGNRKKDIENSLPFATLYLATMAGGATHPVDLFKTLARFKEYGEISKEGARIVEETEVMGIDIEEALENAAKRTPSEEFKEILWGMKTTITVGGDLKLFLHEKANNAIQEHKRRLRKFTQQLSLFIEIYITLIFVGSIFFMILSTIMGGIAGGSSTTMVMLQISTVFLFLPFASIGLLILIKGVSPTAD